jgi:hypothetical protein
MTQHEPASVVGNLANTQASSDTHLTEVVPRRADPSATPQRAYQDVAPRRAAPER